MSDVESSATLLSQALRTRELPNLTPATLRKLGYGKQRGMTGAKEMIKARLTVAKHIYGGRQKRVARPRDKYRLRQVRIKQKKYRFQRSVGVDYRNVTRYDRFRVARAAQVRLQQRSVVPVMEGDLQLSLNGIKGLKGLVGSRTAYISVRLGRREIQSMTIDARQVPLVAEPIRVPLDGTPLSKSTFVDLHIFDRIGGDRMGLIRIPLYTLLQTGLEHVLGYNRNPKTGMSLGPTTRAQRAAAFPPGGASRGAAVGKPKGPFPGGRFLPPKADPAIARGIRATLGRTRKGPWLRFVDSTSRTKQVVGCMRAGVSYSPNAKNVVACDGHPPTHEGTLNISPSALVQATAGGLHA